MYPVIVDEPESKFFFDCRYEKYPYYFLSLLKSVLLLPIKKQCFLPSVQMKMISQNKSRYFKLQHCRTHRQLSEDGVEMYFLILVFEIIVLDMVHCKSNFIYMIPLQCTKPNENVFLDLKSFPEIIVCDVSDNTVDRLIACGFLASFLGGNSHHYSDVEIDDVLLTRLQYCKSIYDKLNNNMVMEKIDCEHLVLTKSKTCVKENQALYFVVKLIKYV